MPLSKAGLSWLLMLFLFCELASGQQTKQSPTDSALTREIETVLHIVNALRPGMTRADVLKNFETEGGISAREWNHYVYKKCPYIKVDVTFVVASREDQTKEAATDKIATVSKPYLEFSVTD
jgi:hypothetical protein